MKQLIVNADDFGLTAQVNRGILDAHREGIVSSATLMATGEAFESAVAIGRRSPWLGVGVHLNLTKGIPVSPPSKIPTLVDLRGRLHLTPGRLWKGIVTQQVNLFDVETELRAQITKVLRSGISPTHLDGHKHVHVLPGISDTVIRVAREFGLWSVRCPVESPPAAPRLLRISRSPAISVIKQYLVGRAVSHFARRFREKLGEAGLICPAHFYGLSQTGFLDTESIREILRRVPEGTTELMCHPGYLDADLVRAGTRLLTEREVELQGLTAPQVRKLVANLGIQLASYKDLAGLAQESVAAA